MMFLHHCVIFNGMKVFKHKFLFFFIVALFFPVFSAFTGEVSGTISYIEGTVDVYRNGELLDWSLVDIGFPVEMYDAIETGDDGLVSLDLTMPSRSGVTVTVQPNTSFYFEVDRKGGKNRTTFNMMAGSMAYKVQKLTSSDSLDVQTASAAMGVRGTEFNVVYSPDGGILVLCNEGKVAVEDKKGVQRYAEPGSVVEKVPEKEIAAFSVDPADLSMYKSYWVSSRDKVFKAGADTFIKGFARQYLTFKPRFDAAYSDMQKIKAVLEKYGSDKSPAQLGQLIQAKAEVSPAVVRMRSVLPVFEMVYYRLKVLEKYHDEGLGMVVIQSGLTSKQFFTAFKNRKASMERRLSDVRYMFKLYNVLNNAAGGGPSILDAPFGGAPAGNVPTGSFPSKN